MATRISTAAYAARPLPDIADTAEPSAFTARLQRRFGLDRGECAAVERLLARNVRSVGAQVAVASQGEPAGDILIVIDGWARRWRRLADGRRALLALHSPGDLCDFDVFTMTTADSTIEAAVPLTVAHVSRGALNEITREAPRIGQALWWTSLVNAATQRAWAANLANRSAEARLAHLLCELATRSWLTGRSDGRTIHCPLSQADLAAACAITTEHANRTLRSMREQGLCAFERPVLTLFDPARLAERGGFDPDYLHMPKDTAWPIAAATAAPATDDEMLHSRLALL